MQKKMQKKTQKRREKRRGKKTPKKDAKKNPMYSGFDPGWKELHDIRVLKTAHKVSKQNNQVTIQPYNSQESLINWKYRMNTYIESMGAIGRQLLSAGYFDKMW